MSNLLINSAFLVNPQLSLPPSLADYKISLSRADAVDYEDALHSCHARGARRLMDLCFRNGGIYIKLGQHIGQLVRLIDTRSGLKKTGILPTDKGDSTSCSSINRMRVYCFCDGCS